jgi:hypothetical protein
MDMIITGGGCSTTITVMLCMRIGSMLLLRTDSILVSAAFASSFLMGVRPFSPIMWLARSGGWTELHHHHKRAPVLGRSSVQHVAGLGAVAHVPALYTWCRGLLICAEMQFDQ